MVIYICNLVLRNRAPAWRDREYFWGAGVGDRSCVFSFLPDFPERSTEIGAFVKLNKHKNQKKRICECSSVEWEKDEKKWLNLFKKFQTFKVENVVVYVLNRWAVLGLSWPEILTLASPGLGLWFWAYFGLSQFWPGPIFWPSSCICPFVSAPRSVRIYSL